MISVGWELNVPMIQHRQYVAIKISKEVKAVSLIRVVRLGLRCFTGVPRNDSLFDFCPAVFTESRALRINV